MTAPLERLVRSREERASTASVVDPALRAEVLRGLTGVPKMLPPKLFYDEAGAALFERITELPEYYLTRAELEILRSHDRDIAALDRLERIAERCNGLARLAMQARAALQCELDQLSPEAA